MRSLGDRIIFMIFLLNFHLLLVFNFSHSGEDLVFILSVIINNNTHKYHPKK
jgi:hypothetical protein